MPLVSIVQIVLRIFALQWLLWSLNIVFAVLSSLTGAGPSSPPLMLFLPSSVLILAAILIWFGTPLIARLVTPRSDSAVNVAGLSRYDLYCFAFVYLGLSTLLANVAPALTDAYQFLSSGSDQVRHQLFSQPAGYRLIGYTINIIAGLMALLVAPRWASKLIESERGSSPAENH
jgi:hypothetical protein